MTRCKMNKIKLQYKLKIRVFCVVFILIYVKIDSSRLKVCLTISFFLFGDFPVSHDYVISNVWF